MANVASKTVVHKAVPEVAKHPLTREEVSTSDWEWVQMPTEGIINDFVPTFSIASKGVVAEYMKGMRYFVPQDVAAELKDRMDKWRKTELRILHGRDPDVLKSQRQNYPGSEPI